MRFIIAAIKIALNTTINMILRTLTAVSFSGFFFFDFLVNGKS
jgi:hypothetical protein